MSESAERTLTRVENAVNNLKNGLLGKVGLAGFFDYCRSVSFRGDVGVKITDRTVIINANGDPDQDGGTAYSFGSDGTLRAVEATTPSRVCDTDEEDRLVQTLGTPVLRGEVSFELVLPVHEQASDI